MYELLFFISLLFIAFFYSSVGHGGASGYLALMALFSFLPEEIRPTALVLNLVVAGISFMLFARRGYFQWKLFLPFAILSVPASFLGGMLNIDPKWYKIILGVFLLFATSRMLGLYKIEEVKKKREIAVSLGLMIGAGIGFFSGLIGIGGGIILSPIILLLGWGDAKEAAASSALFIWVNSIAGLMGQWNNGVIISSNVWIMILLAVIGGLAGGYAGSRLFTSEKIKQILSIVLILASIKLLLY